MKEEKNNINEKPINIDDIPKIDPNTISKIILLDGTILVVKNHSVSNKEKFKKINNINDFGANFNFKLNQIPGSNKKQKNTFSYIEWDFPKSNLRNHSFQRNLDKLDNQLIESKTELTENNTNIKDVSRDSAINRGRKNKNYSYYESKHIKKIINNNNENHEINLNNKISKEKANVNFIIENNNKSVILAKEENNNSKEISQNENKDNNKSKNKEIEENKNENKEEKKEEINNKIEGLSNKKNNKDNLSFHEKIKMIKYGLLDYDYDIKNAGIKNEENNIQKTNKIKPLNIVIDKTKNKNEDINQQFNKLLNKFNEIKNTNNKLYNDSNYLLYKKNYGKENIINDEINRINKFNYTFISTTKNENVKGNSYRDLNERISQLKKKTLNNNLNFFPSKNTNGQRTKLLVLPSNFK